MDWVDYRVLRWRVAYGRGRREVHFHNYRYGYKYLPGQYIP